MSSFLFYSQQRSEQNTEPVHCDGCEGEGWHVDWDALRETEREISTIHISGLHLAGGEQLAQSLAQHPAAHEGW